MVFALVSFVCCEGSPFLLFLLDDISTAGVAYSCALMLFGPGSHVAFMLSRSPISWRFTFAYRISVLVLAVMLGSFSMSMSPAESLANASPTFLAFIAAQIGLIVLCLIIRPLRYPFGLF